MVQVTKKAPWNSQPHVLSGGGLSTSTPDFAMDYSQNKAGMDAQDPSSTVLCSYCFFCLHVDACRPLVRPSIA